MKTNTRVAPGSSVKLGKIDAGEHRSLTQHEAEALIEKLGKEFGELQEAMYATSGNALLIVLQGMDTSGKDGTINHLLHHTNAQSCHVQAFKQPSPIELNHDFLWRIHPHTPARGTTAIFNRSHYEDVLVVRVHDLVPKSVWKARYQTINAFEESLVEAGTIVVKFFLHIDKDEQKRRLEAREAVVSKAYKLSKGDWVERQYWKDYESAYEDALSKCSTENAPWHIVPANHKWFRDLIVLQVLVDTLRPYHKQWKKELKVIAERARADLDAFRATHPSSDD